MSVSEVRPIAINELVLLPELSPRERLNEETIIRYMESFSSLPPVRVQSGSQVVVDGYHRIEAAVRLGLEEVLVAEEAIEDGELRLVAGLANVTHGQPLSRSERNQLAVALCRNYGKLREEVAQMLGVSSSAVTLALREHQYNEMLSEKLGTNVQVINSAHVRALYRVGADQRERLLEAVVSKVDDEGQPYPLTGSELKLLVDRMLDPATPTAELNRLLSDPKARPKPAGSAAASAHSSGGENPFVPEGPGSRPWEREWESPLKGGDTEAFDRVSAVDEQISGGRGSAEERQIGSLLRRAEENAAERGLEPDNPFWGSADAPIERLEGDPVKEKVAAAIRALEELVPQIEPPHVQSQAAAVVALLQSII